MPDTPTSAFAGSLGPSLEPALIAATQGRLTDIRWFRSDWQRGGGSTAFARFTPTGPHDPEPRPIDVVVKVPVATAELRWTRDLAAPAAAGEPDAHAPTPRFFAGDTRLNGYDLGWLVIERLPGQPLGTHVDAAAALAMIRAADRFHVRAAAIADARTAPLAREVDYEKMLAASREVARHGHIPEAQKWNHELKAVGKALPALLRHWRQRVIDTWCHGDLHPGNALWRIPPDSPVPPPAASAVPPKSASRTSAPTTHAPEPVAALIDLALVHPGHWVEDALYFERVYWGRAELLGDKSPVAHLAALRKARGVHNPDDYTVVAAAKRVLTAAAAPGIVEREGNPKYLHAALEILTRSLPAVAH